MHTWGRTYATDGSYTWTKVETDDNGNDDAVYLTALCQEMLLNKGESPFYANRGISARNSIMYQIYPDYDVSLMQQNYSTRFSSLVMTRDTSVTEPTYKVSVITHSGAVISTTVAV